ASFDPRAGGSLDVVLDAAAEVRGRVVRPDGRGVADAGITLSEASKSVERTVETQADGTFAIADVAAGGYELAVRTTSGEQASLRVEAPNADVRVELPPTITLHGRVIDAATRAPVPRFAVSVGVHEHDAQPRGIGVLEAADGTFTVDDVVPGKSVLSVKADGYREKRIEDIEAPADGAGSEMEDALEGGL